MLSENIGPHAWDDPALLRRVVSAANQSISGYKETLLAH